MAEQTSALIVFSIEARLPIPLQECGNSKDWIHHGNSLLATTMIRLISWILTLGICFYVSTHGGDVPGAVLVVYYLSALLLRWWLIRRIDNVRMKNAWAAKAYALFNKYQDPKIVEAILRGMIWRGATSEMLLDSWGRPYEIKHNSETETWCYGKVGKNRYRHRVTFRFDRVKNWTNKN